MGLLGILLGLGLLIWLAFRGWSILILAPVAALIAALAAGESDKSKMLMVGDGLKTDILGGINYGIDTCWFNPKKAENNSGIVPTYEIGELKTITEIVK